MPGLIERSLLVVAAVAVLVLLFAALPAGLPAPGHGSAQQHAGPLPTVASGEVAIEYIGHASFRFHSPGGHRVIIDPYASKVWIHYSYPPGLETEAVIMTHPHYDHDAGLRMGRPFPWGDEVRRIGGPGSQQVGDIRILGVSGRHAPPYGREFNYNNTMFVLEVEGVRIVHVGDNGPLTTENVERLGRADILMLPIDSKNHLLTDAEVETIRGQLQPRILVPMHYRIPELEPTPGEPGDLGDIDPWLAGQPNVVQLSGNIRHFSAGDLPAAVDRQVMVFRHSPDIPESPKPTASPTATLAPTETATPTPTATATATSTATATATSTRPTLHLPHLLNQAAAQRP